MITTIEPHPGPAAGRLDRRQHLTRILFIHRSHTDVERYVAELKKLQFTVSSDVVVTAEQFAERIQEEIYELIVMEHLCGQEAQVLNILREREVDIPVAYLVDTLHREVAAELILKGATDCIEMDNVGHLAAAVARAVDQKLLREQRDRAEKDLRRSEARYRALAGNRSFGVCRCSLDGKFLEVNEAIMKMLGYESREELLGQDLARDVIHEPSKRARLLGHPSEEALAEPFEIEWKKKDQTILKVRLSGREVVNDHKQLEAYEVIAEDVTRQRELEENLRRQAASDPLTGLANYRCLIDVLHSEVKRSKRGNRQFAVLLFDLDGLKKINDHHGHMVGSQALCRLADVLSSCCRDIDTTARFGGDEFAVVLPETSRVDANMVVQRICELVAQEGRGPKLSVSVGVSIYPDNGETIESLLSKADSGLYAMKQKKMLPAETGRSATER